MARDEHLIGVANLVAKLEALGKMEDGKVLRSAARAGMAVVAKAARTLVPVSKAPHRLYHRRGGPLSEIVEPGYAKKHIIVVAYLAPNKKSVDVAVGPTKKAYYATQFVERGTKYQSQHPWLRPAFYQNQNRIKEEMSNKFKDFIAKFTSGAA